MIAIDRRRQTDLRVACAGQEMSRIARFTGVGSVRALHFPSAIGRAPVEAHVRRYASRPRPVLLHHRESDEAANCASGRLSASLSSAYRQRLDCLQLAAGACVALVGPSGHTLGGRDGPATLAPIRRLPSRRLSLFHLDFRSLLSASPSPPSTALLFHFSPASVHLRHFSSLFSTLVIAH